MFTDFINRILDAEPRFSVSNRLENTAEPSVIVKKDSNTNRPIPEKYRKDVVLLQSKYGDAFKIVRLKSQRQSYSLLEQAYAKLEFPAGHL